MGEKKILMVVSPNGFNDRQYEICRRLFELKGYRLSVASIEKGVARGKTGRTIPVDIALRDVKTYDYEAIVFLGGEGTKILFDDDSARKLAKDAKYKVMAASDNAVVLLALSGAAEEKKVTGPPELVGWILKGKAYYTGEPIRIDDKLITIQGPEMTEQMVNAVIKTIEKS